MRLRRVSASSRATRFGRAAATANDRVEVTWEPAFCIHAAECLRGLPAAFDDQRRPWIIVDNGSPGDIGEVIQRCPTDALHFRRLDGGPQEPVPEETNLRARDSPDSYRTNAGNSPGPQLDPAPPEAVLEQYRHPAPSGGPVSAAITWRRVFASTAAPTGPGPAAASTCTGWPGACLVA